MTDPSQLYAFLEFRLEDFAAERVKLSQENVIIGRKKGNLILEDPRISASHCQIQLVEGEYFIFDMNSSNRTWVNGKMVVKQLLKDGDQIQLGEVCCKFRLMGLEGLKDSKAVYEVDSFAHGAPATKLSDRIHLDSEDTQSLVLDITYGDGFRETLYTEKSQLWLGRNSGLGRFDQDASLSEQHLFVKISQQGQIYVENLDPHNESYCNGQKIEASSFVKPEDEILIGSCRVRIAAE